MRGNLAFAGVAALLVVACGSGSASIERKTHALSDFDCPFEESFDPATGQCVPGIIRDNYVSGTIVCRLQSKSAAKEIELGVVRLSGAVGGQKIELSQSAKCIDYGEGATHLGILGRAHVNVTAAMTLPTGSWDRVDSLAFDPHVAAASDRVPVIFSIDEDRPKGEPAPTIAFGRSGTITFERFPTPEDPTLGMRIEVELAPTQAVPSCSGRTCETQADCGMVPGPLEGYPICTQPTDGGLSRCQHFCRNNTDCASAGGYCSVGVCVTPFCAGQGKPAACEGATGGSCEHCCQIETDGAGTKYWFATLYPRCACAVDAPCREECASMCTMGVDGDPDTCLDCVQGEKGASCKAAVDKECAADPACLAYKRCASKCW